MPNNPILRGFHPDPSICSDENGFYLITSSMCYYPGIPIYFSKDLEKWEHISNAGVGKWCDLSKCDELGGIWACTIRKHNEIFYIVGSIQGKGHFLIKTKDIFGSWSEPIWIKGDGHDPDLFFDSDGKVYFSRFTWENGIAIWEMNIDSGELLGEPHYIWRGFKDIYCEAPHLFKVEKYYYLITAEGGTWSGHMATVSRSEHIFGPYYGNPNNPILCNSNYTNIVTEIACTGHLDLTTDNSGNWWGVYLGTRQGFFMNILGRETFLSPVQWVDGWPIVNDGKMIVEETDNLSLIPKSDWIFRRNPQPNMFQINNDFVALQCSQNNLFSKEDSSSFLGKKLQYKNFEMRTAIKADLCNNEEVGLSIYMSSHFHYDIFIKHGFIATRRSCGDLMVYNEMPFTNNSVTLFLESDNEYFMMGYLDEQNNKQELSRGLKRLLSADVALAFSGMVLALYATSNGKESSSIAQFNVLNISAKNC